MRLWLFVALTLAALAAGCSTAAVVPPQAPPPRTEVLTSLMANTESVDRVRVNENAWLKTYPISAEGGLNAIRRQLDAIGPRSEVSGQRFDALTSWALRWSFSYNDSQGSCSIRNATIDVEAVITLPVLDQPESLPPGELDAWQAYVEKLRAHEDGHVNLYLIAARELRDEYLQFGSMSDCRTLAAALAARGEAKIEAIHSRDRAYDAQTGHGAIFP